MKRNDCKNNRTPKELSPAEIERIILENNVLKQVTDDLMEGVYITDDREVIMWFNKDIEESDAKNRKDVIGKTEAEAYGDIGRFHKMTTQTGRPVPMRPAHYYLPDGRRTDVIMTTRPYLENGVLKAVYTVGFNVEKLRHIAQMTMVLNSTIKPKPAARRNRTQYCFDDIIGRSPAITNTVKMARKAALGGANVLIYGETGTGKELVAQSIHNASHKSDGQFVAINCSAIPETLLESLLFGTAKGAFTGAVETPGLFELANGGSLFLDEINSMPMALQVKMLRVLQEKEVQRLGERKVRQIDCRVISASNADPLIAIRNKELREDLYFRLAAITIHIPPLRDRIEDLVPLMSHFFKSNSSSFTIKKNISRQAFKRLNSYGWPGNVRELKHALVFALTAMEADDQLIDITHLPLIIQAPPEMKFPKREETPADRSTKPLPRSLAEFEYELIAEALAENKGHLTNTAAQLGISRQTLTNKINRLNSQGFCFDSLPSPDL